MTLTRYLTVLTYDEARYISEALRHHATTIADDETLDEADRAEQVDQMLRLADALDGEMTMRQIDHTADRVDRLWLRDDDKRAWTPVDEAMASFEGWKVERTDPDGSLGLQHIPEAGFFESDQDAVHFVKALAMEGSELHRRALALTGND